MSWVRSLYPRCLDCLFAEIRFHPKFSTGRSNSYQPGSDVVWHNNLDKDVKAIDDYVDAANLIAATAVYTDGGTIILIENFNQRVTNRVMTCG